MEDILNKDPFNPVEDFFGGLKDYQPEEIKDEEFKPIKGKYVARVARLTHNIGLSTTTNEPYDFYSLNIQITETIEGDRGNNRYLSKRFQNNLDSIKKLCNALFTAGIPFDNTGVREAFDLSLTNAIDKTINIRAYIWTPEKDRAGNLIPEEDRTPLQMFNIVKNFSDKKKSNSSESIPY